jgi:signal peptidase I
MTKVRPVTNKKAWTISIAASILLAVGVFVALFGAGFHLYIVKTPSMGTTAPVGTLVAVHAQDSYAIGDVVSYARNGVVYTHRIVDVTAQGFITKGDINGAPDALPVNQSEIVGTVTFYGKYLGFLVERCRGSSSAARSFTGCRSSHGSDAHGAGTSASSAGRWWPASSPCGSGRG